MKGTDRRRDLLAWLNENGSLSLTEIVSRYAISKMTAHRDLDILEKRHSLKRIHGGAIAVTTDKDSRLAPLPPAPPQKRDACSICHRPVGPHLLYSLTQMGGEQRQFCCPHCGVSAQLATTDQLVMAMATDFLSGQPHPAQQSWFVLGSDVVPCCRPSMLTFEDQSMARRFQIGFGGRIGRLKDALEFLREEMSLHQGGDGCPHCSSTHKREERKGHPD